MTRRSTTDDATTGPEGPDAVAGASAGTSPEATPGASAGGQLRGVLRAAHPRLAAGVALAVALMAAIDGRAPREVVVVFVAVLLAGAALGLHNDVVDAEEDRGTSRAGKPLATGVVPPGNSTFAIAVLGLILVPVSFQVGFAAGFALLAATALLAAHNTWWHRGRLSWLGPVLATALLPAYLAYGGWGGGLHGGPPSLAFTASAALVGLCLHLGTSLPDLVIDDQAGRRTVPLAIGLRTGATRLRVITVVLSVLAAVALLTSALLVGLRQ